MDRLFYMGINGSLLIIAVLCFRHVFSHQVPRRFFVFLWVCAIVRLLVPVAVPVRMHTGIGWNTIARWDKGKWGSPQQKASAAIDRAGVHDGKEFAFGDKMRQPEAGKEWGLHQWTKVLPVSMGAVLFGIWLFVCMLLAVRIFHKHMRSLRCYRASLPARDIRVDKWLQSHRSLRNISVRQSDLIKSPLTYGLVRPVILLPSAVRLDEEEFLCIMEHEWIHICWWDIFVKYLACITVCIYWFHPLVWMMAALLEQDMEMACDEQAVKQCSPKSKKRYVLTLIRLAEGCGNAVFAGNARFARHLELEERIWFIMKTKKYSWKAAALAAGMLCCIVTTFTVSAQENADETAWKEEVQKDAKAAGENSAPEKAGVPQEPEKAETVTESAADAKGNTATVTGEEIAALAEHYIGEVFSFQAGGTDLSSGVDSEGFVRAVYAQAGIELPAELSVLANGGDGIALPELRAGDLVIYQAVDMEGALPQIGIYDGSGQVVHFSNLKDGVKASDLYYREISLAVRALK